jgi:hypothetical protein
VTVINPKVIDPAAQPASQGGLSWLDSPYRLLIRTSLALGVGAGFSLGLYLLLGFAFGLPLSAATPALMQVHVQVQVFGFLAMFIMAVGVQLFPRFHATRLDRPAQVSAGGMLLATGVALRAIAQPSRSTPRSGQVPYYSAPCWLSSGSSWCSTLSRGSLVAA